MYTEMHAHAAADHQGLGCCYRVLGSASAAAAQGDPRSSLDEARSLFYNGRYEAATATMRVTRDAVAMPAEFFVAAEAVVRHQPGSAN